MLLINITLYLIVELHIFKIAYVICNFKMKCNRFFLLS